MNWITDKAEEEKIEKVNHLPKTLRENLAAMGRIRV